jgi:putative CocE/NonD family hydrolase
MRDGVALKANVFLPHAEGAEESSKRLPVLLYRTPYCKNNSPSEWTVFDRIQNTMCFALVCMDVRGRYASEGDFSPYFQEIDDGYDSIEWCAAQSFCNGKVATFGISYPAAWQLLACSAPHLVACVPAFTYAVKRL